MIVLKVYLAGVAVRKNKCHPPVLIDLHRPRPPHGLLFSSCRSKCGKAISSRVAAASITSSRSRRRVESSGGIPHLLLVSKNSRKPLCLNDRIIQDLSKVTYQNQTRAGSNSHRFPVTDSTLRILSELLTMGLDVRGCARPSRTLARKAICERRRSALRRPVWGCRRGRPQP